MTGLGIAALTVDGVPTTSGSSPASYLTIYPSGTVPAQVELSDHHSVELGVRFAVSVPGTVEAIRFYKAAADVGAHTGTLWSADGDELAGGAFTSETTSGWQVLVLAEPVAVFPGADYVASYHAPVGQYAQTQQEFDSGTRVGNSVISASAGVYAYGSSSSFPRSTWRHSGYGVDVEFHPTGPVSGPTPTPPTASAPASPSTSASPSTGPGDPTGSTTSQPVHSPTPTDTMPSTRASGPSQEPPSGASTDPGSGPTGTPPSPPDLASFPNDSDTGVPAGTTLVSVPQTVSSGPGWHWDDRGWVVIDGNGAQFSGYRVTSGAVEVYAADVVIKNDDLQNAGNSWAVGLRPGAVGTIVQNNDIHGPCLRCDDRLTYGVNGDLNGDTSTSQIIGNDFYDIDHPLQQESGLIKDNYVHDLATLPSGTDHVDAFFSGGGDDQQLTIEHNTLLNDFTGDGKTASIMLNNYNGRQSNRLIENNLIAGGNYAIYGGSAVAGGSNVVIRDNAFSTVYFPRGGYYGPIAYLLPETNGNVFAGNVWADGPDAGKPVG